MKEKIVFGFGQITSKTPLIATWVFRVILYAAAIANLIVGTITEIPEEVKEMVGKYSVYAVTLTHALTRMFGIQIEQPSYLRKDEPSTL